MTVNRIEQRKVELMTKVITFLNDFKKCDTIVSIKISNKKMLPINL